MTTKKLTKLLALYLPYILLGLVATNFGEAWRLAEGKELGDKIMSMMGTVPLAFANPLPSLHPLDLLVGLCCGAGLRLAVYLRGKNAKKYRHGMEYGSARWGTPKDIEPFMAVMKPIFPALTPAENMLYTSFDLGGAILHVIPTLMNINKMDMGIPYDYYCEGSTPHIAALMEAADQERAAVCEKLRIQMPSLQEWMEDCYGIQGANLYECIQKNEAYRGVKSPANLKHRFIAEEIHAGFVPMASIAQELDIDTPIINAFIHIAHVFTGIDYWSEGRTAEKLGLAGLSAEEMRRKISK